jgi:hypothetical protein
MCKRRKIFKNLLLGIMMLMCATMLAQEEKLIRAQQLYRMKDIDKAKVAIDSVITDSTTAGDFISWSTRAFIYYELYKRTDKLKLYSDLRDTIISSALISQKLKPDSTYSENNRRIFNTLALGYLSLTKTLLHDSLDYDRSLIAYNKYKELYALADPTFNFTAKDIEYYLAVGSVYSEIFIKDNKDTKAQETAKVALLKVLEIQQDNANANINMGLMFYNQAVNLTKSLQWDADFSTIDVVQDNIVKLAKQSEQFIYKVYYNDNKNPKAVEALYYIYRMLNEYAKSDEFKAKCKELGINVEQSSEK